jgi:hypothetical protein
MKGDRKYMFFLAAIFILLVLVEYYSPKPVNWKPTFSKKDKIAYGDYVVFDYLSDIFPGKQIKTVNKALYNTLSNENSPCDNYIIITDDFEPDTLDMDYLCNYVKAGHSAFISSDYFGESFADSIKFKAKREYNFDALGKDSTSLNFAATGLHSEKNFEYKKGTVENYFESYDTGKTAVLGQNSKLRPNFIAVNYGKGKFFLSTVPFAFTNYNALKKNNGDYISAALSYLPVADTYWDEYYKPYGHTSSTPISFILENISLKYAYFLLMFALLLYVIFEGKRKQRTIPVIVPMKNTSLEFVETIGRLYYQKGTTIGIAHKKILFFLDYVRTRYNVTTTIFSDQFYASLSSKTQIPVEELQKLFTFISNVQASNKIEELTLISLNNQIENFYRKTK